MKKKYQLEREIAFAVLDRMTEMRDDFREVAKQLRRLNLDRELYEMPLVPKKKRTALPDHSDLAKRKDRDVLLERLLR